MYNSDEEIEVGTNGDDIAILTDIDEPFWLMLVDKVPYVV